MQRFGILGAAGIAPQAIIEPARRRGDVVVRAVASRRAGVAADYAKRHRIPVAHEGYEALLADPEVDVVYNALPPSEHARWSIAALQAGDIIEIDLRARTLDVRLSAEEIENRLQALPPFQSRTTSKWLKRYSYFVTSADTGAVLSTDGGR